MTCPVKEAVTWSIGLIDVSGSFGVIKVTMSIGEICVTGSVEVTGSIKLSLFQNQ